MDATARAAETTRTICPFMNLAALALTDSTPSMEASPTVTDTNVLGSGECI